MAQPDGADEPVRLIRRGKRITVSRNAGPPRPVPVQPYSDLLIDIQEVPNIVISDPNDFPPATFLRPLTPTTPTGGMPFDTSGYSPPDPYINYRPPPPPSPVNSIHSITSSVEQEFAWRDEARAILASGLYQSGQSSRAPSRGHEDRLASPSFEGSRPSTPARDPRFDPYAGPEIRKEMMERIERFAPPGGYPSSPVTAGIFALSMPAAQKELFMKGRPLPPDPAVIAQEAADAEVAEFAPPSSPSHGHSPTRSSGLPATLSPGLPPKSGWKPVPQFTPLPATPPETTARDKDGRPIFAPKEYYHPSYPSLNYSMLHLMDGWDNFKISAETPDFAAPRGLEFDVNTRGKLSEKHGDLSAAVKVPNRLAHLGKMVKVPAKGAKPGGKVRSRWRKEDSLLRSESLSQVHNAAEGGDTSMTNTGIPRTPRLSPRGSRLSPDGTPNWDDDLIDLIHEPPPSPVKRRYFSFEATAATPDHGLFHQHAFATITADMTISRPTNPGIARNSKEPGEPWEFAGPADDNCSDYPWPPPLHIASIMKRPFQLADTWDQHPAASDPRINSVEDFLSALDNPNYTPSTKPRPMTRGDRIKASAARMTDSSSWQTINSMKSGGGDPDSPAARVKATKKEKAEKRARREERANRIVAESESESSESESDEEDSDSGSEYHNDGEEGDDEYDGDTVKKRRVKKNKKATPVKKNRKSAETPAAGELSGHFVEGVFVELAGLHINGKRGPNGRK
ncbi:hypothetical protein FPQ18DRAFT_374863 [Pyronema domesticum]|uniref:Uncharacterized protein n=1 Tax=Pyronema omphalodes (strain CBS 100304) TaxID=1076935 RepID=U4LEZ7_PYROM|nr:hypothetical protein FPQ18DRAFT_374863 [Pyronema domesticum]CCX13521.1 Protein of unknown function [Pyronema omphalodes CBS 100304]